MACTRTEGPAEPQAASGATSPSTATAKIQDDEGSPWHWRSDAAPSGSPTYLVGLMGQTGIEHCPGGEYEPTWLSVRPRIGRVTVSGPDDARLEPLMDQPVLALGQPGDPPPSEGAADGTATVEPCPPAQMRSDWQQTPRGMLMQRDPAPTLQHLRMEAIRPLHELQVREDGEHLVVTLTNPVPLPLTGVELRTHYEGCFGKPGTHVETTPIGELGVGAQASARVSMHASRPGSPDGRREFHAFSVQLLAQGEGVVIDLDVPFGRFGITVGCPAD